MELLEYQSKQLFQTYGIPIPRGNVISSRDECQQLLCPCVIKAQIPLEGREKFDAIQPANSSVEIEQKVTHLLGLVIKGHRVQKLLVEEKVFIKKKLYVSICFDPKKGMPVILVSSEGGDGVENLPDTSVFKKWIDPLHTIDDVNFTELLIRINLEQNEKDELISIIKKMHALYCEYDCSLVEINPLIVPFRVSTSGVLLALDATIILDDNSLFRHKDMISEKNEELTTFQQQIIEYQFSLSKLDGELAIISNGFGITWATIDCLSFYNIEPGIIVDIGDTDDPEQIKKAVELVLKQQPSKLLIHIIGITHSSDTIAQQILSVLPAEEPVLPMVTRITGIGEIEARTLLSQKGIICADTFKDMITKTSRLQGRD